MTNTQENREVAVFAQDTLKEISLLQDELRTLRFNFRYISEDLEAREAKSAVYWINDADLRVRDAIQVGLQKLRKRIMKIQSMMGFEDNPKPKVPEEPEESEDPKEDFGPFFKGPGPCNPTNSAA